MKFRVGDKVVSPKNPNCIMTIHSPGNYFDWNTRNGDSGGFGIYDEDELELFIEDGTIKDIVWHYISVPKHDIAIKLNELGLKPGEFSLVDDTDYTALIIYNYPKNS